MVSGRVQSIQPYGAFVEIGPGVNGLLHISQVSHDMVRDMEAVMAQGDDIKARPLPCSRI